MLKKIVITGGAGFIGSHVVDECIERGYQVCVLDNFSVGKREHLQDHKNLQVIRGDILDTDFVSDLIQDWNPTHVVHLAAIHFIPYCIAHPLETIDVNIKGTESIFQAVSQQKQGRIEKMLIASSAAVYAPSEDMHKEESAVGPTDIYGFSKYANELQSKIFSKRTGIPTIMARIFNAYGPRETNPHLIPEIVQQLANGSDVIELGNVETKRSYIYVKDLARGLVDLLEVHCEDCKPYNIGSTGEYNAAEIVECISQELGRDIHCSSVYEKQRKSDRPRLHPSLENIYKDTNWKEQYDIHTGLKELLSKEL